MSRIKHTPEEKELITKAVLSGERSQAELARRYNTSEGRIREWVAQYKANGISAFLPQRRNSVYSEEIRIKAVKDYLNGQGSLVEISSKYGIRDARQLLTSCFWQKKMPRFSSIVEYVFVVNEMPDRQ